ncbi:MAG: aminopeptidase [Cyanobacteriota bacterium]
MLDIWRKYAEVLVNYSVGVKKNQVVIIRTMDIAQPLVKRVYEEVLKVGAYPLLRITLDGITDSYYKYATDEQLDYIDDFTKLEYEKADAFVSIGAPHNLKNLVLVPPARLARRSKATKDLMKIFLDRAANKDLSWVGCDFPTNALAQEAKMSLDDYSDFLFNACHLYEDDPVAKWKEIHNTQQKIIDKINGTNKIRVVGQETDITLSVEGRKWINCAGNNNFPDGEIFTSPVENSANGHIYFDMPAIYRGSESENIRLEFLNGKVVKATAQKGEEFFLSMIDQDNGARFLGEFAIGTNENIQQITGNILFDEKIGGSIHMALGASYPETGGNNESGLHWDLIKNMKAGGQIFADDKLIYENGKFLI